MIKTKLELDIFCAPENGSLPHMADGKPKAFTKDEYRQMATADLGAFSKAAFDHAWVSAIEESDRQDWYAAVME